MAQPRRMVVLRAIVEDYIRSQEPIGSAALTKKHDLGVSSATIRNDMASLEEEGYLIQPHTSSGRIPTEKGYRYFVDRLSTVVPLSDAQRKGIAAFLYGSVSLQDTLQRAARLLSHITGQVAVVASPSPAKAKVLRVQIVPVSSGTAMLIIVTSAGIVKDAVINIPEGLSADHLYGISRMLTERLAGQPIESVRQIFADIIRDMGNERKLLAETMQVIEENIAAVDDRDVYVGGSANLLNYPEYSDVDKAKNFLSVLESRDTLRRVMGEGGDMEITIRIGPENGVPELSDCSVLTASYRMGDQSTGTLGIIGPTRMNYSRVVTVLGFMGRAISQLLSDNK